MVRVRWQASCVVWGLLASTSAQELAGVEELVRPLIEGQVCVGLAVGVVRDGRSQVRGFGSVARGRVAVPDGSTVYEIGSISKVFTGTLLADAVSRGLVGLEDPLQTWLPEGSIAPVFVSNEGKSVSVRIAQLVSHSSGLPRLAPDHVFGLADPYWDFDAERVYAGLARVELARAPGSAFDYSNYAVGLLGQVLADRHGKTSFEELLRERICDPLGLADTRVALSAALRERLAPPYDDAGLSTSNWNFRALAGAGGVRSTMDDMLTFARANLGGEVPAAAGHLPAAFAIAQRPIYEPGLVLKLGGAPSIGCGWHIKGDTIWHDGATGGYRSNLILAPKSKIAVCVLANSTSPLVHQVANQVFELARGKSVQPLKVREAVDVAPERLRKYVGTYGDGASILVVTEREGRLMVKVNAQSARPVLPASTTRFFFRRAEAEIEFELEGDEPARLVWIENDRRVRLDRRR